MVKWHHQLEGHESEQAPGAGEGQGGLVCCSPRDHKQWDPTWQLNNNYDDHGPKWSKSVLPICQYCPSLVALQVLHRRPMSQGRPL